MKYRHFGKTDMKVSVVGVGAWQAGMKSWGRDYNETDVINALRTSFELGINFVDTAEIYGNGYSEKLISRVLADYKDVYVATKVAAFNTPPNKIRRAVKRSIERLGVKCIDLYQIHWPPSVYSSLRKSLHEMERMVDEGLIRHVGVSNFSLKLLKEAIECMRKYEIVSNQVQYSLLFRAPEKDLVPFMKENKIELIAWSPIAKGALAGKYKLDSLAKRIDGVYRRIKMADELLKVMKSLSEKYRASYSRIALAWVIHKGGLPIPGAKNPRQAEDNALASELALSDLDLKLLDEASQDFISGKVSGAFPRYVPHFIQSIAIKLIGGV